MAGWSERPEVSRLGIALAASLFVHFVFAGLAELSSRRAAPSPAPPQPIEISRVARTGGASKIDSTRSGPEVSVNRSPVSQSTYGGVDAGVPVKRIDAPAVGPAPANPNPRPPDSNPVTRLPDPGFPISQPPANDREPPTDQNSGRQPEVRQASPLSNPRPATQAAPPTRRSRGPNRVAMPIEEVEPNVPASMMTSGVQATIEVTVDIAADGSTVVQMTRSTGSDAVDGLVLDALRKWKWDPAARDNVAVKSTQSFRFTFKPRGYG